MSTDKKKPAVRAADQSASQRKKLTENGSTPTPKIWRAIALLNTGHRFNRWDFSRLIHDSCGNSTMAEIARGMGHRIAQEETVVRGYRGTPTRCKEYFLEVSEQEKAQTMLRVCGDREAA